jgi:hypothetical protein
MARKRGFLLAERELWLAEWELRFVVRELWLAE